jgi:hypothetical protein
VDRGPRRSLMSINRDRVRTVAARRREQKRKARHDVSHLGEVGPVMTHEVDDASVRRESSRLNHAARKSST